MGIVYKAEDTQLQRLVALKFLPPHIAGNQEEKARFLHEARSASALNHTNVTTIHGIEESPEGTFLVMEYVEGKTLKQIVENESLSLKKILEIGIQVCEGLNAAHKKEIVHRDIKADNLMVTREGQVKIMDFGLAKLKGGTKLTKAGSTVGTAAYMSPEQAQGDEVDQRTDIFSFGVVLYELLTRQLPFKGEHQAALIYAILSEEPQPIARYNNNVVSPKLEEIVSKALSKDKEERYQHIDDLLADLRRERKNLEYARTAAPVTTVPNKKKTSWRRIVLPSSVVLLILGYLLFTRVLNTGADKPQSQRKMLAVLPFENLGSADDEYFADGISEEITVRLANLQGLGVIARTSVMQYKNTNKTVRQIGEELGVDYVLEGTIRWQKLSAGQSRVRVTPQLIRVKDATHLWAQVYDEELAEVFKVQSAIASQVTSALDVALRDTEQQSLEFRPTTNPEAYLYYMQAKDYLGRGFVNEEWVRVAIQLLQQAIQLDSGFALAYARLSEAYSALYWFNYERTNVCSDKAKQSADRALDLDPGLGYGHISLGVYYYWCQRNFSRAVEEFARALESEPNNARVFALMAFIQRRQGKWDEAVTNLRKAVELNPRRAPDINELGTTYRQLRDYKQAEQFFNRAISLAPDWAIPHIVKADMYLYQDGNSKRAWEVLKQTSGKINQEHFKSTVFWFHLYDGNYQEALAELPIEQGDTLGYYFDKASVYELLKDQQSMRVYYDSARQHLEHIILENSREPSYHAKLGVALAGLGRKDDAIREGKLAVDLLPVTSDAIDGVNMAENLVNIYIMVGEQDAAVELIEYLLSIPGTMSIPYLRTSPNFIPLRTHPRFQKIISEGKGA